MTSAKKKVFSEQHGMKSAVTKPLVKYFQGKTLNNVSILKKLIKRARERVFWDETKLKGVARSAKKSKE